MQPLVLSTRMTCMARELEKGTGLDSSVSPMGIGGLSAHRAAQLWIGLFLIEGSLRVQHSSTTLRLPFLSQAACFMLYS